MQTTGIDYSGFPSLLVGWLFAHGKKMSSSLREQRSDSMTAPLKLEPKVTHLYATQHSYPHLAQSPYIHTHTHSTDRRSIKGTHAHFLLF